MKETLCLLFSLFIYSFICLYQHGLAAYQAPLSMGFAKEEYWSGLPLPSPELTLALTRSKSDHSLK